MASQARNQSLSSTYKSIGEAGVKTFSEAHIFEDDEDTDDQNGDDGEDKTKASDVSEDDEMVKAAEEIIGLDNDSDHGIKQEKACVQPQSESSRDTDRGELQIVEAAKTQLEAKEPFNRLETSSCSAAKEVQPLMKDALSVSSGSTDRLNPEQRLTNLDTSDTIVRPSSREIQADESLVSQRHESDDDEEPSNSERLELLHKKLIQGLNACIGELKGHEERVDIDVQLLLAEMHKMNDRLKELFTGHLDVDIKSQE